MNDLKEIVKSTKQGKLAAVFAVLAVLSIIVWIAGSVDAGSGITSLAVFLVLACVFYLLGKKNLSNPPAARAEAMEPVTDNKFKVTKNFGGYIQIDAEHKKWRAPKCKRGSTVYAYDDLLNFGLVEDGNTLTKGGKGSALAGGIMFGAVGAIVGGVTADRKTSATCSKMQVVINVNNLKNPALFIDLVSKEVQKNSSDYQKADKTAQQILAALEIIAAG